MPKNMIVSKCPICGKPGIPDFTKEDVVCPHCGSDLGIYKTISEVAEGSSSTVDKRKQWMLLIALPIIAALLVGVLFYLSNRKTQTALRAGMETKDMEILQLKDSVSTLTAQLQELKLSKPAEEDKELGYVEYTVVHRDSPWRIVHKFFGVREDWSEISRRIAKENDLWDEQAGAWKIIHPGQIIKVYKE